MRRAIAYLILLCFLGINISGCAVAMSLHGKREADISDLRQGMSIEEAHFILRDYTPAVSIDNEGNRIESYKLELGNEPSGGRALGHLIMDVLT